MGMISRVETIVDLIKAQEDYFPTFERVGWLKFMCMFNGYNVQATKAFAWTFNGECVKIGDIELQLNQEIIAKVTKL